jgi:hypothetical protein
MNAAEQYLISLFDDKDAYFFWKLKHDVHFEEDANGSAVQVWDENGKAHSYDNKPHSIVIRTNGTSMIEYAHHGTVTNILDYKVGEQLPKK